MNPIGFIISYASLLRQKSGKPLVSRTRGRVHMELIKAGRNMLIAAIPCKRVRMEHIRPLHVSMRIRLCFMLTFVSANIMLQTVDSGLCRQNVSPRPAKQQNGRHNTNVKW